MPYYKGLFDELELKGRLPALKRVAAGIIKLRREFKKQGVPARNLTQTLLLATWNIREFGKNAKFGPRTSESKQYIAEIISHFDLIAIQEVNHDLKDLKSVLALLGDWWDYIVTDITDGRSGNDERIAFVYDSRKVRFDHVAGEVVFPATGGKKVVQAARSPFLCAFKSGWRRFSLCSVHIYYGTANPNDRRRVSEIATLAQLLAARNARRARSPDGEPDNVILLGDFNIFNKSGDKTSKALADAGFIVPTPIRKLPSGSNLTTAKYYDQIAYLDPRQRLRDTSRAGIFDFQRAVYGSDEEKTYASEMADTDPIKYKRAVKKSNYYKQWRTFQLSDHLPLWIELQIDFSGGYIATRAGFNVRRSQREGSRKQRAD
jgi:endonuclease/exonuclease/phosphatase family metal-dependent hydrolase